MLKYCLVLVFLLAHVDVASSAAPMSGPVLTKTGLIKQYAATSCYDLLQMGVTNSQVYWLQPPGVTEPFQGYCDMKSFGGGWLMCYTDNSTVNVGTETHYDPNTPYPNVGYRTNCNGYGFNEVFYMDHDGNNKMYFQREKEPYTCNAHMINFSTNNTFNYWTGMTTPYSYTNQLVICQQGLGLFMSGYTSTCWKNCNDWCGDRTSNYYRMGASMLNDQNAQGIAFNANGYANLPAKKMSVGLRYRVTELHPACQ